MNIDKTLESIEALPSGDLKYIEQGTGYKEMTEPYVTTNDLKALAAEVKQLREFVGAMKRVAIEERHGGTK